MLPNLIVIGSTKSGTTSLHRHLDEHPEIMMSTPKELRFFLEDWNWQGGSWGRGIEWYESQFDPSAPIRGESTPAYTTYPFVCDVPEKMARVIPSAKLLYIVRDPLERIISDCLMTMRNHPEDKRTFLERIVPFEESIAVARSRYFMQLERFLAHFPSGQILVVEMEELTRTPAATMARVFRFLGVEEYVSARFQVRHNEGPRRRPLTERGEQVVRLLDRALGTDRALRLRRVTPRRIRAKFSRPAVAIDYPDDVREQLVQLLREDAQRLRAHTGLAFSSWSL